jgi:hypothetical protein
MQDERFEREAIDVDLARKLPYGPAACDNRRKNEAEHMSALEYAQRCPNILLAPKGASTHVLQQAPGERLGDPSSMAGRISNWRFEQLPYDEVHILEDPVGCFGTFYWPSSICPRLHGSRVHWFASRHGDR